MSNQLCFLISFLFLVFWSPTQILAVEIDRSIPEEILRRFSKLEIGRNVISLSENHLTTEDFERMQKSTSFYLPERFHATILMGDKRSLWDMCKTENKLMVRKIVEGSIESIPVITSELNKLLERDLRDAVGASILLDLVEGITLFSTFVMNLQIHETLADLSSRGNPIAQLYMAKLLKHFSVKRGDSLDLASQNLKANARSVFEKLLEEENSFSIKGLYCEYLEDDTEAAVFFQKGVEKGEAFAHYRVAQKKEYLGEEDALDFYERAFILGYEKALLDIGRLHTDDNAAFLIFKKAGERGNAEAYFLIAQMIREGFVPLGGYSNDEQFWLSEGIRLGSLSSGFSIGKLYEKREDLSGAIAIYETLVSRGNIRGVLELGRIKENQREFGTCKTIYQDPKAGWFGFYALAAITPNNEKKAELKRKAVENFNTHFERIIAIATAGISHK